MKKCAYCGRENDATSSRCTECGRDLAETGPPSVPPAPSTAALGAPPAPGVGVAPKTSGLAVTSFVMGLLGGCGITALIGIVCGIIGLVRINNSNGRLKGKGLAIAGLCLSGFFLLCVPIMAGLMLPALAKAKARAQRINCVSHMKQLALGVRMYANEHQDRFPSSENWCDAIEGYLGPSKKAFHCPSSPNTARSTYAFNAKLSGLDEAKIHPSTVMLFEIADGWNVSGGLDQMLEHDPHFHAYNVALADGSVHQISAARVSELRWDP